MTASAPEQSSRTSVARVAHELRQMAAGLQSDGGGGSSSIQQRAIQLAGVAATLYDNGGASIRLPLQPSNPLVSAMRKALDRELKSGGPVDGGDCTGARLAEALLEGLLQAQDEGGDNTFPFLIVGRL